MASAIYHMDARWAEMVVRYDMLASLLVTHSVSFLFQYLATAILLDWDVERNGPATAEGRRHAKVGAVEDRTSTAGGGSSGGGGSSSSGSTDSSSSSFGRLGEKASHDGIAAATTSATSSPSSPASSKSRPTSTPPWQRLQLGYSAMVDFRRANTPWQSKGIPPLSTTHGIPAAAAAAAASPCSRSRTSFLIQTFLRLSAFYLLTDLLNSSPRDPASMRHQFSPSTAVPLFSHLSSVSISSLSTRLTIILLSALGGYSVLSILYSLYSLLSVFFHLSAPDDWPPLFGAMGEASTLRGLWGCWWHQLSRLKFSQTAAYGVYDVLGAKRGGLVGRYAFIGCVFAASGLQHFAGDRVEGLNWKESGCVRYFAMQAVGIVVEDAAQEVWRRIGGGKETALRRRLGYLWVVAWQVWTLPGMTYPKLAAARGERRERIVQLSLMGFLGDLGRGLGKTH